MSESSRLAVGADAQCLRPDLSPRGRAQLVEIGTVKCRGLSGRRLEHLWDGSQLGRTHERGERAHADLAVSEIRVAIPVGAAVALRVVEVKAADGVESESRFDVFEPALDSGASIEIGSGSEGVAGVEAKADALGAAGSAERIASSSLERAAEVGALARRVLEQ